MAMDKKSLSEGDICTKFITPALRKVGWDEMHQIREEVSFTKGRIIVRGKLVSRGKGKRADYILYYKPNIPIALINENADPSGGDPLYVMRITGSDTEGQGQHGDETR
jgi:type I restriction enzyme, R subunit